MSPADAGALLRYADDLADSRVIPIAAVTVLQRLTFRYRPKGGRIACVGLDELAGDGMARGTLITILDALERAFLIVKEKWGVVIGGRWRQMPNRYHLRTATEAKAAAMEAGDEPNEPEIVHCTVSLPPCESKICTVLGVLEEDSTLPDVYPREQEGADTLEALEGAAYHEHLARLDAHRERTEGRHGNPRVYLERVRRFRVIPISPGFWGGRGLVRLRRITLREAANPLVALTGRSPRLIAGRAIRPVVRETRPNLDIPDADRQAAEAALARRRAAVEGRLLNKGSGGSLTRLNNP